MKLDRPFPLTFELDYHEEREPGAGVHRWEVRIDDEIFGAAAPEVALKEALVTLKARGKSLGEAE